MFTSMVDVIVILLVQRSSSVFTSAEDLSEYLMSEGRSWSGVFLGAGLAGLGETGSCLMEKVFPVFFFPSSGCSA